MDVGLLIVGVAVLAPGLVFALDFEGYGTRLLAFARDFGRLRPPRREPIVSYESQRLWFGWSLSVGGFVCLVAALLGR